MQMLLLLTKRKPCCVIHPLFAAHHHHHQILSRCGYASASSKPINSMMVDYLVASFGFSLDKAAIVSKPIAHLKSPEKPEVVRSFLNHHGFSEADIKTVVSMRPQILSASPENTLEPNLRALHDIGLPSSTLTQLILSDPATLQISSSVPTIKFWRDFFHGDEAALVKAFKMNLGLGTHDINRIIAPNISLLQSRGLNTHGIQRIVLKASRIITSRVSLLEDMLNRVKELGFQPNSGMFAIGLHAMLYVNREALHKKMEFFKSFGWSEDEFIFAIRKSPSIVKFTENNLQAKMNFLTGEARCDPSYVALNPVILLVSLEKRLRPRLRVMHLLESKGLSGKRLNLGSVIRMTDTGFAEKYLLPHEDEIAGLHEASLAASH